MEKQVFYRSGKKITVVPNLVSGVQCGCTARTLLGDNLIERYYPCGVFDRIRTVEQVVEDFYNFLFKDTGYFD